MKRLGFYACVCLCLMAAPVRAQLTEHEQRVIQIFDHAAPSVVFIKNAALQWDWFSVGIYEVPMGAGSGFIWDYEGHVITNFHVIYQADRIQVVLSNQKTCEARVVGYSPDHDLAVLKVDAPREELRPLSVGSSRDLQVGQTALSIGNPFGLDHSLTTGVVSALGRNMRSMTGRQIYDVIQTDAAINPGNSGGPLLNSRGEVIGIATAIYSPSGADAGIGFAIPIDDVKRIVPQLIQYGRVRRPGLGIVLVPDAIRMRMGVQGAMILALEPGGPAEQAGLQETRRDRFGTILPGDVITALDENSVSGNDDLIRLLESKYRSGDRVRVRFYREGRQGEVELMLREM